MNSRVREILQTYKPHGQTWWHILVLCQNLTSMIRRDSTEVLQSATYHKEHRCQCNSPDNI